ncbi:hypothetical protein BY458DRAFT_520088 [Sporodiniella umbellata]|nr:hypothetical protein BY458DRAFT_520088 [Sporodiniella umbellata]
MVENLQQSQLEKRYFTGILALSVVVCIWVGSSFVLNNVFSDLNYDKPFMITYINTATFSLYLLPYQLRRLRHTQRVKKNWMVEMRLLDKCSEDGLERGKEVPKLDQIETIKLSVQFCLLWFLANYVTNASLSYTSVTSSTILSSTSGLFTLIVGALCKVERFHWTKAFAVLLSLVGVMLVTYSDNVSPSMSLASPLTGDLLAFGGAVLYGCYTIFLKQKIGDESRIEMPLFFGWVGIFNLVLMWPFFWILNSTGTEPFELPYTHTLGWILLANAFIGTFLSDYLWLLAMLMTSPLLVTLGISLTIPLAILGDACFENATPTLPCLLGAGLIVAGFFLVNAITQPKKEVK